MSAPGKLGLQRFLTHMPSLSWTNRFLEFSREWLMPSWVAVKDVTSTWTLTLVEGTCMQLPALGASIM
jgi:hypothetical protein